MQIVAGAGAVLQPSSFEHAGARDRKRASCADSLRPSGETTPALRLCTEQAAS
jgi:hypothetical protein